MKAFTLAGSAMQWEGLQSETAGMENEVFYTMHISKS